MSDKPTMTRCDGICARCDGAGTIPDWSSGQLPCPACKPMEQGEAVTAGAIRQSLASGEAIADVTQIQGLVRERNDLARQLAESRRIQPNDRYCPQCGTDTLRHAPDGTEYYGAHTQETCLEIRLARAQERAEQLQRQIDEDDDKWTRYNDLYVEARGEVVDLQRHNARLRTALEDLVERAERARRVLQESGRREGLRPDQCGWGVLDTTAARAALASAPANPYAEVIDQAIRTVALWSSECLDIDTLHRGVKEIYKLRKVVEGLPGVGREEVEG